jgi:uncharacterized repeat protein (TIGR03803 family)
LTLFPPFSTISRLALLVLVSALCLASRQAHAQAVLTIIHTFQGNSTDPSGPKSKLLQGPNAVFYGTSQIGGTNSVGAIYALDTHGNEATLYSFTNGTDGDKPAGGLALAPDGETMYGTSENGTNQNGAIFSFVSSGSLNVIHPFAVGDEADGASPNGDLVLGPDKQTFYGTTSGGGGGSAGIVFSVSLSGSFRTLASFDALGSGTNATGSSPASGLTFGKDGALYGVTPLGGATGNGTVFRVTTSGSLTDIHDFEPNGGTQPNGELALGPDGNLYGVANFGGFNGLGSVYRITTSGSYSDIHDFSGGVDGALPIDITVNPTGILGGLTSAGSNGLGSIFLLYPPHYNSIDHSFTGGSDGQTPTSGMIVATDGNFYGTTGSSPTNSLGTGGTFFEVAVSNKTLQEFDAAAGHYFGTLDNGTGDVSLKLSGNGKFSGRLLAAGKAHSLAGTLSVTGTAGVTLSGTADAFTTQLLLVNGNYILTGSGGGATYTALRSVFDAEGTVSGTGQYGLVLQAQPAAGAAPAGDGYATLKINRAGVVSLSGKLPDGDTLRSTGLLLQGTNGQDEYQFFNSANLYGGLQFADEATTDLTGSGNWVVAVKKNKYYPLGFSAGLMVRGARYTPPARGVIALPFASGTDNGTAAITGGGLATAINETITLTTQNKIFVSGTNPEKLRISVNAPRGTFSGSFVEPSQTRATSFSGILYQKAAVPGGFAAFLGPLTTGTNASGSVELGN